MTDQFDRRGYTDPNTGIFVGAVTEEPLPTRGWHCRKYPISDLLRDIPPGKVKPLGPPRGISLADWQRALLQAARPLWGECGYVTTQRDGMVLVWRLTEDQRAAYAAKKRERREKSAATKR